MAEADDTLTRWRSELTAAFLARAVAAAEADPARRALFGDLARAGEEQAEILARDLPDGVPRFRPGLRARLVARLIRWLGPRRLRPVLAASKVRGLSAYAAPPVQSGHPMPTSVEDVGGRHRGGGGGTLRAAVFGINDGLVSNASLVMGVAGAAVEPKVIVVTGVAGLLAGAFSMAAGEYVSMRSQREMFEYQIAQEREELDAYPDEEAEELALIYHARGIPRDEAHAIATRLVADPVVALDTLAREELGLNPDDLGSPWGAALWSFLAFAVGAVVPLVPFFVRLAASPVAAAAGLTAAALFAVGAALSLFSGRSAFSGGLRMTAIGAAAAGTTFIIGRLFGVAVG